MCKHAKLRAQGKDNVMKRAELHFKVHIFSWPWALAKLGDRLETHQLASLAGRARKSRPTHFGYPRMTHMTIVKAAHTRLRPMYGICL